MPKTKSVGESLPTVARSALRKLGENLAIARKRRKEPQRVWAERIGISLPTLIRLEKGDPGVSMGAYASALWLAGRVQALGELAAPSLDIAALEQNIRAARERGSPRHPRLSSAQVRKPPNESR